MMNNTTTKTKAKSRATAKGMLNLQPGGKPWQHPEHKRTTYASARLSKQTKDKLSLLLREMDLSLGDFLEKIADGEISINR